MSCVHRITTSLATVGPVSTQPPAKRPPRPRSELISAPQIPHWLVLVNPGRTSHYPVAGLEMLVPIVGFAAAKEIFFTARRFSAAEALRMGSVNQVLPKSELDAFVRTTAQDIAANAPLTLRSVKLVLGELARDPTLRDHDAMLQWIRACNESAA